MFRPHRAIIRLTKMVLSKVYILVAPMGSHGLQIQNVKPWDPIGATKIYTLVKTIFVSLMMAL